MKSKTITVVIPVHSLKGKLYEYLKTAIDSVLQQKVKPDALMIVGPTSIEEGVKDIFTGIDDTFGIDMSFVLNPGDTKFQSQMNVAVNALETTHFVFLEMDDVIKPIWIDNVVKYLYAHNNIDCFLPIVINTNEEGNVVSFTNEPVWADQFSDTLGELDVDTLKRFPDFSFNGMVMSKDKYVEFGGLKESIELTFALEFLLRVCEKDGRIMVIPKFGYEHRIDREGSMFREYKNNLSLDEQRWWLSLAKKEYFHINDRNISYDKGE